MDQRVIVRKLEILSSLIDDSTEAIDGWQARTATNPSPGEYVFDGEWADAHLPAPFQAGKTAFLRASVAVQEGAPLADTYFKFAFRDMEGLLRVDGEAYAGVDANHMLVPVPKTGAMSLELEYSAQPHALHDPALAATPGLFLGASIVVLNRDVFGLFHDVDFANKATLVITEPRRKQLLEDIVETAMLAVDLTLPRDRFLDEVRNARAIFAAKLAQIAPDPESGSIYAVGHTHIDTAWLWPLKETVRKCGRSFSTACRLMERNPDFRFACSQPQLYQYTKDYYPEVYAQIKKWVGAGQWLTTGAMWVEADCNVTSGESLIRQILHGLEFFKTEFGTRPRICWLPDVFGYPASLPEILAGCGVEYFYTYKLHWQAKNPFPNHLFHWRGLDGSEVLAAVINHASGYNCIPSPGELQEGWARYAQKAAYPEVIFPYGYGDGGGGVTDGMIEMIERAKAHYPGLPALRTGTAEGYFDDVAAANPTLPVWDGELYVETHRGTYTSQSALKKANRESELMLRDAEIWGTIAQTLGCNFIFGELSESWKLTLLSQFHDILPGSSIAPVYVDALADHARVREIVAPQIDAALAALAPSASSTDTIRLFNSLSWTRNDAVQVTLPHRIDPVALVDWAGAEHPAQRTADGSYVVEGLEIPSVGFADFRIAATNTLLQNPLTVTPTLIDTPLLRIAINANGALTSVFDKRHNREVIAPDGIGNDLQLLQDGPEREDAWNIHETVDKRRYPIEGIASVEVVESGPVRGIVRVTRTHRSSTFVQDIVVTAASAQIDFVTRVDWQERHTVLKAAFPVAIRNLHATYEVQFGAVERPTHQNTSWDSQKFEVPAQRWADLSESGYGVSLLNDCRYGYDTKENILRLTLLRGTTWPDPEADRGKHEFTYSLLPHAGNWTDGETVQKAWELNAPVRTAPIAAPEAPRSFVNVSGASAILEALKPAEDGDGLIARFYEPHGARGTVIVTLALPASRAISCNLVEEGGGGVEIANGQFSFAIKPFEIRTFRILP